MSDWAHILRGSIFLGFRAHGTIFEAVTAFWSIFQLFVYTFTCKQQSKVQVVKNLIFFGHFGVKNEVIRPMDGHIICMYIQVMMSKIRILIYLKKYIPVLDAIWWKVALKWVFSAATVETVRQTLFIYNFFYKFGQPSEIRFTK